MQTFAAERREKEGDEKPKSEKAESPQ